MCSKEFKRVSGSDGVAIYMYTCFGVWHASEVNNEFPSFGCSKWEVIVCTPCNSLVNVNVKWACKVRRAGEREHIPEELL